MRKAVELEVEVLMDGRILQACGLGYRIPQARDIFDQGLLQILERRSANEVPNDEEQEGSVGSARDKGQYKELSGRIFQDRG